MSVWLWAYLIGAAVSYRPLVGAFAWDAAKGDKSPEFYEWVIGGCACLLVMWFWPLIILALVSGKVLPKVGPERKGELAASKRRVKELERELGL